MGTTRDLHAVLAPKQLLAALSRVAATYTSASIDTMAALTTSDLRENLTNMMILMNITFGNLGTVDITIQDSADNTIFAAFGTLAQALQTDGETLYSAEIRDFRRYVRLSVVVGTQTSVFSIEAIGDRSRREPVVSEATELNFTAA